LPAAVSPGGIFDPAASGRMGFLDSCLPMDDDVGSASQELPKLGLRFMVQIE